MEGWELEAACVRSQMHEFANQLQVALGWLQLGRAEEARRALQDTAAWLAAGERLLSVLPAEWACLLLVADAKARRRGMELSWKLPELGGWVPSRELLLCLGQLLDGAIEAAAAAGTDRVELQAERLKGEITLAVRPDAGSGVAILPPAAGRVEHGTDCALLRFPLGADDVR